MLHKKKEREKKLQLQKKNHAVEEEAYSSSGFMLELKKKLAAIEEESR